jgi:multiple sugar transport system substrate-binding protein
LRPAHRPAPRAAWLLLFALLSCTPAAAKDRVELRLWALGREGEVVETMVRDFEREHPGVRVRVQQIPWTAAHEKLLTAHVGDATPDLAQLGNTWVPEFQTLGALEPLDPLVAASTTVNRADYFKGIWDSNVIDGTTYGVPWYVDTRLIFYRTDILTRAGYPTPPRSWAEWRSAMAAVKRQAGPGRYAIFLPTNEWAQPVLLGMQAGSPLLKDGGRYGAFSDSAFRRAFDFYLSIYREGLAPVAGNNDVANVYQEFARGQFAMWITGPWNIGEMKRRLPAELQGAWGTAALPGPTGDSSGVSLAGGSSLVVFRASRHKKEAWALVEFLSSPERQVEFARLTGDLPARREAWRRAGLADDRYTRAFWEQLERVRPTPQVPEWELIATKVLEYSEQAIRGGVPAATVLQRLDRDVNEALEKRRWMLARHQGTTPAAVAPAAPPAGGAR